MKKILTFILTVLLFCRTLSPLVLAEENTTETETTDGITDSDSGADADDNIDTLIPSIEDTNAGETADTDENTDLSDETHDNSVPDGFDYTDSIIFFTMPNAFMGTFDMDCGDTSFSQLHNALDSVAIYGTAEKDGTSHEITMSVVWDFTTVDAGTPDSYTAFGSISIPEGATLSEGLEDTISICVLVPPPPLTASPSAIILTSFDEPDRTDAVAFAVGTTQTELAEWFADSVAGFTGYDAEGNPYDLISGTWSLDAVDTGTIGVYYASVAPNLETEYTLADGVSLPRQLCAVSIQTPGEPDINCCVAGRGFLRFPWVLSGEQAEQLDEFAVWLRQDGAEWTNLREGFCLTSGDLQLSQHILAYGSTYELKVTYPGGQTGVLSFQYDGQLSILDYSGGDRDGGDVSGDDSGTSTQPAPNSQTPSDSNENDNPTSGNTIPSHDDSSSQTNEIPQVSDSTPQEEQNSESNEARSTSSASQTTSISQNNGNFNSDNNTSVQAPLTEKSTLGTLASPAKLAVSVFSYSSLSHEMVETSPMLESTDTPAEKILEAEEPVSLSESYSPTQTVISGLRLRDLCTDGESVVFGSGNLTVSIPSSVLFGLNLSDSDTLSVWHTQLQRNQILLAVEVSGKLVTELTGTVLRLRYMPQSENTEITVKNEAGEQITDASYDGELLRFAADAAGTYTIVEHSMLQKTKKGMSPLFPVSGGLFLAAGGIAFFRRNRHG